MSRRLLLFPALLAATAALWSSFGVFSSAGGQEKAIQIHRAHDGAYRPRPNKVVYVLAIGSDAREHKGQRIDQLRGDSLHIIAIDPKRKKGSIVGIPRDTYVPIPGHGRSKINAALYFGGPKLMVETVEDLSGCRFDYYMLVGFQGLKRLVNDLGGVPVDVPARMVDDAANIDLQEGRRTLDGDEALGFSRSRKTAATPRGDFDRSLHQGLVMLGALRKAREELKAKPGTILRYLAIVRRHVTTDMPLAESLELGMATTSVKPDDVTNAVTDGGTRTIAGAGSIVELNSSGTNLLADVCADGIVS